jgi:3-hydroxymyristoyl/3-hydroxydecanoyl-(acyl carrier protein) dehydratase
MEISPVDSFMQVHPWAYPGVIMEESVSQVAALLVLTSFAFSTKITPFIAGNDGQKNTGRAYIGDELIIGARLTKQRPPFFFFEGWVTNKQDVLLLQVFNIKGAAIPIK